MIHQVELQVSQQLLKGMKLRFEQITEDAIPGMAVKIDSGPFEWTVCQMIRLIKMMLPVLGESNPNIKFIAHADPADLVSFVCLGDNSYTIEPSDDLLRVLGNLEVALV